MRLTARQRRHQALWNWVRWTPVVAIPLSVLFADAWLQTQDWRRDFEMGALAERQKTLRETLSDYEVASSSLHDLDRLKYMATNMGLMKPNPTQIISINGTPFPNDSDPFALATILPGDTPVEGEPIDLSLSAPPELMVLEEIPDSPPVQGISLVTLETAEDDLEAEFETLAN